MEKKFLNSMPPIGIFDSGVGGLTVLNAFLKLYPRDHYAPQPYVYIGDTARLPYGTKSPETVRKYSITLARALEPHAPRAIVVACNTASTHGLSAVQSIAKDIPCIGMIDPAVDAALRATRNNHVAVIGTTGTIKSSIYQTSLQAKNQNTKVSSIPCQMLVALAEEDWANTSIARDTIKRYLDDLFDDAYPPDTLILGCTHFPLFENQLHDLLGANVTLINTGLEAARTLAHLFTPQNTQPLHAHEAAHDAHPIQCYATDNLERFKNNMERFLTQTPHDHIKVDLLDI